MKKANNDIPRDIPFLIVGALCVAFITLMPSAKATTYAVPSQNYVTEGRYYEYYTEAVCNVVAVSADKSEVYVSYGDDVYCFNTKNTECQPGDKVTVTFNEAMQIVNAE